MTAIRAPANWLVTQKFLKHLLQLVPIPIHSANYMFPAFCLDGTGKFY